MRKIGARAFEKCPMLSEVVLNDGLVEIGDDAFADTPYLRSVYVPSTVRRIGRRAFPDRKTLTVLCDDPTAIPSEWQLGGNIKIVRR